MSTPSIRCPRPCGCSSTPFFAVYLGYGRRLPAMILFYIIASVWFAFYGYRFVRRADQFSMPLPRLPSHWTARQGTISSRDIDRRRRPLVLFGAVAAAAACYQLGQAERGHYLVRRQAQFDERPLSALLAQGLLVRAIAIHRDLAGASPNDPANEPDGG